MQMFDCYDSGKRYIGLFVAANTTELAKKYPNVRYISGYDTQTNQKKWYELVQEDLVPVEHEDCVITFDTKQLKTKKDELNECSHISIQEDVDSEPDEALEAVIKFREQLKEQIKAKEKEKKTLLAEVKKLREEIKELQKQLEEC